VFREGGEERRGGADCRKTSRWVALVRGQTLGDDAGEATAARPWGNRLGIGGPSWNGKKQSRSKEKKTIGANAIGPPDRKGERWRRGLYERSSNGCVGREWSRSGGIGEKNVIPEEEARPKGDLVGCQGTGKRLVESACARRWGEERDKQKIKNITNR